LQVIVIAVAFAILGVVLGLLSPVTTPSRRGARLDLRAFKA